MATQHFAAAQYVKWLLRVVEQTVLAFTAGTQRPADKTCVNEIFNKTSNARMT